MSLVPGQRLPERPGPRSSATTSCWPGGRHPHGDADEAALARAGRAGRSSACCRRRDRPQLAASLADEGVTAVSLDGLPRTLSRAQGMDALSSQANVAGYKAVLAAAEVRPVLPAADHRGRHGPAGEAARARHRRGRPAGDRDRPAAGRPGQRVRRAARDQGRGRVARARRSSS